MWCNHVDDVHVRIQFELATLDEDHVYLDAVLARLRQILHRKAARRGLVPDGEITVTPVVGSTKELGGFRASMPVRAGMGGE